MFDFVIFGCTVSLQTLSVLRFNRVTGRYVAQVIYCMTNRRICFKDSNNLVLALIVLLQRSGKKLRLLRDCRSETKFHTTLTPTLEQKCYKTTKS